MLRLFLLIYLLPVALGLLYRLLTGRQFPQVGANARAALLPSPADPTARIRILFRRVRQWRGAIGGHSWIVYKRHGAPGYVRYDYDGEAVPIRSEGWVANDPAFGYPPTLIWSLDGPRAEAMIPDIEAAIRAYGARHVHDYRRFKGPNSNTFIQGIIDGTPGMDAMLPPNALGKEYPHDGPWLRRTKTGLHLTLGGSVSFRIGWIEGLELNLFCLLAGLDWRRPALKLPSLGRIGLPLTKPPPIVPGSGRLMIGGGRYTHPGAPESGFTTKRSAGKWNAGAAGPRRANRR